MTSYGPGYISVYTKYYYDILGDMRKPVAAAAAEPFCILQTVR